MQSQASLILKALKHELDILGGLILATPSGSERNTLCDVQIHLMEAIHRLEDAA